MAAAPGADGRFGDPLMRRYLQTRERSVELCRSLAPEDYVVQSMPDVSPAKWHLAHITWFFETFVLQPHASDYRVFDERYAYLFNSYYYTAGQMHARPRRGLLSRPTVAEVLNYRQHVDDAVVSLLAAGNVSDALAGLITLGLNHERQHQELMLTDIKHVLSCNPLQPAMREDLATPPRLNPVALRFESVTGGTVNVGHEDAAAFCFDNETPRHTALLHDHAIANRLVTNAEYLEFMRDGGYQNCELWLSDGWATVNAQGWRAPLYWRDASGQALSGDDAPVLADAEAHEFTLGGLRALDLAAPVSHVSFYEADAFARWAGARLPTEFEWEHTAASHPVSGNFAEADYWQPVASDEQQWFGDVWEWTSSAYSPYPGFKPLAGSLGEYNGKFMCNQMTVRGGSCASAVDHIRASYRSFFYPNARWQFLGLRLAKDA